MPRSGARRGSPALCPGAAGGGGLGLALPQAALAPGPALRASGSGGGARRCEEPGEAWWVLAHPGFKAREEAGGGGVQGAATGSVPQLGRAG